jgi:hypothetical protein
LAGCADLCFCLPFIKSLIIMRLISAPAVARAIQRQRPTFIAARHFADVQVEHARGPWKTYGNLGEYQPGKHHIRTYNKISSVGLSVFKQDSYEIFTDEVHCNPHAILLRSYKLLESEVPHTVRAIARYVRPEQKSNETT